jgi:glycosyltransferase involved in cell wall biosynthesis
MFDVLDETGVATGVPSPARRRVLVSAFAVSPVRGSEPGVGWNICVRLAAHHDVTVLCSPGEPPRRRVLRDEIEAFLREHGPVAGLTFHFVEMPALAYLVQRESLVMRRTLYYAGYRAWQKAAYKEAARLQRRTPFDVIHQLTMTGFREPGYLWRLPVPFVWGPIGGAANVPPPFLRMMGWREQLYYGPRNVLNWVQQRTSLRCRRAAQRACHLWAIGDAERRLAERIWGRRTQQMCETGASPRAEGRVRVHDPSRPLRIVWSGVHLGRKALPVLLEAIASLSDRERSRLELVVAGDGPEHQRWRALATRLGISPQIRWTGWLPRPAALDEVAAADVMAFTGVQEGTPHTVLEAFSYGLPVICHDACGMGTAVTDACGIKVRLRDPATSVAGFAAALRRMIEEPQLLTTLSRGALDRAGELSWDAAARRIADTYRHVLAASSGLAS